MIVDEVLFCFVCQKKQADLRCETCGPQIAYCFACFLHTHKAKPLRSHACYPVNVSFESDILEREEDSPEEDNDIQDHLCAECMLEEATWLCEQCGDHLCADCFSKLHEQA